jgi:S1-C subfamily serine protease
MNGAQNYPEVCQRLGQVAAALYGGVPSRDEVSLRKIYDCIPDLSPALIDTALQQLASKDLVALNNRGTVVLSGYGKETYELQCIPEVCLGPQFLRWKYGDAVLRLVVRDPHTGDQAAATGFVISEPPNCVVTAKHVIVGKEVLTIEDRNGNRLVEPPIRPVLGPDDLDLAFIDLTRRLPVEPLRIDWDENGAQPQSLVLVLGYPYIPFHAPGLLGATGEINGRSRQLRGAKEKPRGSLTISRVTIPGYSGGPVIGFRGLVVGIVRSEDRVEREGAPPEVLISATPSHYLREVLVDHR